MNRILIMHASITKYDAVGNDIEGMYHILNKTNDCVCYAENIENDTLRFVSRNEAQALLADEEAIAIYHHSTYWESGEKMITDARAKIIIRYHNITPEKYFKPFNYIISEACRQGRLQTERLKELSREKQYFWLADSLYNASEIDDKIEKKYISVCAPFHKIEEWLAGKPDESVLNQLSSDNALKLLFVGRIVPNKGHSKILEALNTYITNFDENIRLYLIGNTKCRTYFKKVKKEIQKNHLSKYIEFVESVNDAILMSYYMGCDIFLCTSEHEGFCVPIIEAQRMELPVIAKNACAVPETIGKNQVLLDDDAKEYAAALRVLSENQEYREYLKEEGLRNYRENFTYDVLYKKFANFMKSSVGVEIV